MDRHETTKNKTQKKQSNNDNPNNKHVQPNHTRSSHLRSRCGYPDAIINGVREDAGEHVPLPVNLTSVDFVKQSHHHKSVEDDGEMLGGYGIGPISARIDIK
jgi:hypothetical protein